jgi:hypothetical protein
MEDIENEGRFKFLAAKHCHLPNYVFIASNGRTIVNHDLTKNVAYFNM